jgi:hypothetical protein
MYISKKLIPTTERGIIFTNSIHTSITIIKKLSKGKEIKLYNLFTTRKLLNVSFEQGRTMSPLKKELVYLFNGNVMSDYDIYSTIFNAKLNKITVFILFYNRYLQTKYYPCPLYVIDVNKTYVKCERLHKYSLYVQHISERRKKISFSS